MADFPCVGRSSDAADTGVCATRPSPKRALAASVYKGIRRSKLSNPQNPIVESRAAETVRGIFESGRPLMYIRSSEEQRVARILREVAKSSIPIWTWSLTEGLHRDGAAEPGSQSPRAALDFIDAHPGPAIFQLKDFHDPLRDSPETRRRLRDVYESCLDQRKF